MTYGKTCSRIKGFTLQQETLYPQSPNGVDTVEVTTLTRYDVS